MRRELKEIVFNGIKGRVEGLYYHSLDNDSPIALICPGFKEGQNLHSDLMIRIAEGFIEKDFSVLIFNYRGIGSSEGEFSNGEEELLEATTALNWLHEKNPESKSFWLCGFDFGALMTLELVMRRPEIENYILISPDLSKRDLAFIVPCTSSGLIIRGSLDIENEDFLIELQDKLITKSESLVESSVIQNSSNDYFDKLSELKEVIVEYIDKEFMQNVLNAKNIRKDKRKRRRKNKFQEGEENIIYSNPIKILDLGNI